MRKVLPYSIFFLLLIGASYLGLIFIFSSISISGKSAIYQVNNYFQWKGGGTYEKFQNFEKNKQYDVIVTGSSRAYRGYDPTVFKEKGIELWNLGTSAQTIRNTYHVINHYVSSENCKLLIIDIYPTALMASDFESGGDLIANIESDKAAFDIALSLKDFRAVNMFLSRLFLKNKPAFYYENDYLGNGFSTKTDSLPNNLIDELNQQDSIKNKIRVISNKQLNDLEKLLKLCETKKVNTVIVFSPTSDFYSKEELSYHLNQINPIIAKFEFPFFDYSKKLDLNTTWHFYDPSHLNSEGVKIFNYSLIQNLEVLISK